MFKQNNSTTKRQTILSFGQKPKAAGPVKSANGTRASTTTTARAAPYTTRPSVSRQTSSTSMPGNGQTSPYFNGTKWQPRPTTTDTFSAEVSARMNARGAPQGNRAAMSAQNVQPSSGVKLSQRQLEAFDMAVNKRHSMFITGSAGTGKSVLLKEIIRGFRQGLGLANSVVVTASTGIAAFHVGGKTIHSFSGVGWGKGSKEDMLKFVKKSRFAMKRWSEVSVLIIDEVSMLDANLFDALEYIAREVRRKPGYFGGIQVILTGDFYQLPPVEKDGNAKFAFEAQAWMKGIEHTVVLTHVFRQKDMRFVDILNEMRLGRMSDSGTQTFRGLSRAPKYPNDGILATELYALRHQVDDANRRRLQSLSGKLQAYAAYDTKSTNGASIDTEQVPEDVRAKIDGMSMTPRVLELKQHAQVMLVKNMPESGLVNGSRGVVTGFAPIGNREYPVVRFTNGVELTVAPEIAEVDVGHQKYSRSQLPLILAWALSIHKSQGQTIDRVLVDLGKVFERGQAYVALSRAVSLEALQVLNFKPECVMAHPRVIQYYAELARTMT